MKKLSLLVLAIILSGCNAPSRTMYTHQLTMNSFEKDKFDCELISRNNTMPVFRSDIIMMMKYQNEKSSLYDQCLASKGYYQIQVK